MHRCAHSCTCTLYENSMKNKNSFEVTASGTSPVCMYVCMCMCVCVCVGGGMQWHGCVGVCKGTVGRCVAGNHASA